MEDFREFLTQAHDRGLQVMIELVINHTSDQHPWFQRARHAPKGSPERDFYVWSDTDQKYQDARIIFTDTEKSNWTWDPEAQQYYWHRFFSHQPDLNYDNPRGDRRSAQDHALLARHGRRWAARRCHSLPGGARRNQLRKSARNPRSDEAHSRTKSTRSMPPGPSWPRPTSGRTMCASISATAMSATWHFTFR